MNVRMLFFRGAFLIICNLSGLTLGAFAQTVERWSTNGPFGAYTAEIVTATSNPSTMFAGTLSSGIYKSIDGGANWAASGFQPNSSVFAIAVDPNNPNIIYANARGGSVAGGSRAGVYKSTNGGESWTLTSLTATSLRVYSLLIDPSNPSVIYAATEISVLIRVLTAGMPGRP